MLGRLILLFLLTPAVELGLLIQVNQWIGFGPTIGLIIATGIAGSYLARREGLSTWKRLNQRLASGEVPGNELVEGIIILMAGALLVTPGVLTDLVGFLGLLPPSRTLLRNALIRRFRSKMEEGSMQVQFGLFGGPGSRAGWPSSNNPPSRDGSSASSDWAGTAREVPHHTDPSKSDASTSDPPGPDERRN